MTRLARLGMPVGPTPRYFRIHDTIGRYERMPGRPRKPGGYHHSRTTSATTYRRDGPPMDCRSVTVRSGDHAKEAGPEAPSTRAGQSGSAGGTRAYGRTARSRFAP